MKKFLPIIISLILAFPYTVYADAKDDRIVELEAQIIELQKIIDELNAKLALYEGQSVRDLTVSEGTTYILNTKSHKIHLINGVDTDTISDENRAETSLTMEELLSQGYTTCGRCFK